MSDTEVIAGALRDLAERAVTVPPAADALWRAGQRRRRLGVVATSAAAAAVVVVAVGLAVALGGLDAGHRGSSSNRAAATVALSTPILFKQVAAVTKPPCPASVNPATGRVIGQAACTAFTGTGMAITRVESGRVQRGPLGRYHLELRLTPADARRYATLTRELAGQHGPRNRLAVVANGHVLGDPVVRTAATSGQAAIPVPGFPSKPQAEFFLATLLGG